MHQVDGSRRSVCYALTVACVAAQAATLAITWPLWQVRDAPPNLPALELPQLPFGWLLALSLVAVLAHPRIGWRVHVAVLLASFVFDQFRVQPQVIGVAVLMVGVAEERAREVGRWYLVALWFWSGLHKYLSPDWFGPSSWNLLEAAGLEPGSWHGLFAYSVAIGELSLGLAAIVRPRWAAFGCIPLHVAIAALLAPWALDWNHSVIPWNLCIAAVGPWLLWNSASGLPRTAFGRCVATVLVVSPAGFYVGLVDGGLAHALYSDNQPRGLITSVAGLKPIDGWGELEVPFPYSRRSLRQYFALTAEPGAKLHVTDPRPWLADAYYLKSADGLAAKITRDWFLASGPEEVAGVEQDDARSVFALSRAGARMLKRTAESMIYAVEIPPDRYRPELLDHLHGLPNLEQLQLGGCPVADNDLRRLVGCDSLLGIGLGNTDVTDDGVEQLMELPKLRYLELENTGTSATLRRLLQQESN